MNESLALQIEEYFTVREKEGKPFSVTSLAAFLGINRHKLAEYKENKQYSAPVKKAYARIEADMEDKLLTGKPPIGLIFSLKNNFHWADRHDIDITSGGEPLGFVLLPPKLVSGKVIDVKVDPQVKPVAKKALKGKILRGA